MLARTDAFVVPAAVVGRGSSTALIASAVPVGLALKSLIGQGECQAIGAARPGVSCAKTGAACAVFVRAACLAEEGGDVDDLARGLAEPDAASASRAMRSARKASSSLTPRCFMSRPLARSITLRSASCVARLDELRAQRLVGLEALDGHAHDRVEPARARCRRPRRRKRRREAPRGWSSSCGVVGEHHHRPRRGGRHGRQLLEHVAAGRFGVDQHHVGAVLGHARRGARAATRACTRPRRPPSAESASRSAEARSGVSSTTSTFSMAALAIVTHVAVQ